MEITYVGPRHIVISNDDGIPFSVLVKMDHYDMFDMVYTLGANHWVDCRVSSVDDGVKMLDTLLQREKELFNHGNQTDR